MFKNLKKLFSVEEEDLEIDHKKITDEHYEAFKNELKQFNLDKTTSDFNDIRKTHDSNMRDLEDENLRVREIDGGQAGHETVRHNDLAGGRKNFDFEKEIDKAYDELPIDRRKVSFVDHSKPKHGRTALVETNGHAAIVEKNDNNNKRVYDVKDLVINPDDYVLRDIISPMKGIVRKEANPVVNKPVENLQKKSKIIKIKELRNQVDVSEIDDTKSKEKVHIKIEEKTESKRGLSFEALENPPLQTNGSLAETSRFTIVEDSTGEMRLFTDEQEE